MKSEQSGMDGEFGRGRMSQETLEIDSEGIRKQRGKAIGGSGMRRDSWQGGKAHEVKGEVVVIRFSGDLHGLRAGVRVGHRPCSGLREGRAGEKAQMGKGAMGGGWGDQ